jgi:hypothetical protein
MEVGVEACEKTSDATKNPNSTAGARILIHLLIFIGIAHEVTDLP